MSDIDAASSTTATFCATLVDEWIALGVRHAVIAPGSRSTPMALALVARDELQVHVVIDERSAAFTALGIGLSSGQPAVLLCTSGTAATHFHAAVVEAHQAEVPLIVVTADRPPELRDVGAAQTIDQNRLYGGAVRWYCDPGVPDAAMQHAWRTIAMRAHAESMGITTPGPVHVNLPFREPLVGVPGPLPPRRLHGTLATAKPQLRFVERPVDWDRLVRSRGVIIAGYLPGGAIYSMQRAAQRLGWPILAEARSIDRRPFPEAVAAFDAILRDEQFALTHVPDVVVRVGQAPASKVLAQWLASSGALQIQVGGPGPWNDPSHDAAAFSFNVGSAQALEGVVPGGLVVDPSWLGDWSEAERRAQGVFDVQLSSGELSEPAVARTVSSALPDGHTLLLSSSMPVRDVEWFGVKRDGLRVLSNRGANGIDGVVSTAVGIAATRWPTTLLIGDVAFLHDQGALTQLARRQLDLTIVVIDNDGGGIFEFLPQATSVDRERFEQLFGTPHGTDLPALVAAHGLECHEASTVEQLRGLLGRRGTRVIVVRTSRIDNVSVHRALNASVAAAIGN
ncbi:MAG: 2-succinyl-5-enolpyruvyl-6-hydroxy-3-cyclohexene-1-carboxylic-acid synthase [Acidimicrobiia bacterium]